MDKEQYMMSTMLIALSASVAGLLAFYWDDIVWVRRAQAVPAAIPEGATAARPMLEAALREALAHDEFTLCYQPRLDLKQQRISGVKALLRWDSPQLGLMMPPDILPVLESSGLILPVGEWVLAGAVAQARRWIDLGQALTVTVNLSARQFFHKDIVRSVAAILEQGGVAGRFIELEIAQSTLIDRNQNCAAILRQFRQLGVGISISDFGTGVASPDYLKRFPVDVVRIDKCLIDALRRPADDGALLRAIIARAHALKMKVIAGGVETSAQLARLGLMDCDEAFGFCMSGAVLPAGIDLMLKRPRAGLPARG